jgi:hypothetical protein
MANETRELRSKYLNWCAAQIARTIVSMPPEEVFRLASSLASADADQPGSTLPDQFDAAATATAISYRSAVGLITDHLRGSLIDFDSWLEEYRLAPESFDSDLPVS